MKTPFQFEKYLEFMKNAENSVKYRILSSFDSSRSSKSMWDGGDQIFMKARYMFDCFLRTRTVCMGLRGI